MNSFPAEAVRLESVRKSYREAGGERRVLDGVDLELPGGSFTAVTGPSGSGKSTLLNVIAGIERADAGGVRVGGEDIGVLGEPAVTLFRRRHVGIVFQFFNLVPTLTVRENLVLPLDLCGLPDDGRAESLLQRTGLSDRADSFPDVLSGGEQQRVAVARAMVHRPRLLLADEPTGNLDERAGAAVLDLLDEAVAGGATVLMVTHSGPAAERASRRLVLRRGRLEG